jgi:GxxExxY protein
MSDDNEYYYKKDENYTIVGLCMEVHRILGPGLLEIVYKDALEIEFKNHNIPYEREKRYDVEYKGYILPHNFYADFVVYDDIILEVTPFPNLKLYETSRYSNWNYCEFSKQIINSQKIN